MPILPPPDQIKKLETRVQDCLSRFLDRVAVPVSDRPKGLKKGFEQEQFLLGKFAEELGRVLHSPTSKSGSLRVVWVTKREILSARVNGPGAPIESDHRPRPGWLRVVPGQSSDLVKDGVTITWRRAGDVTRAVCVSSQEAPLVSLWLLRPAADRLTPEWHWFQSYLPGLKSYFVTLRALMQTVAAEKAIRIRSDLDAGVTRLSQQRGKDFSLKMQEIGKLLDEMQVHDEIDCLDLTEDLAVTTLQDLMGTGWAVRQVGRLTNDRPSSPGLFLPDGPRPTLPGDGRPGDSEMLAGALSRYEAAAEPRAADPASPDATSREARKRRIREVARCFRALLDIKDADPDPAAPAPEVVRGEEALALLPLWTRVHEACRSLCRARPASRDEKEKAVGLWGPAVQKTLELLPRHLELYSALPGTPPEPRRRGSLSARNWLALWLALQLLTSPRAEEASPHEIWLRERPSLSDRESCNLHADFAYLMREALRFACFGNRADYFFQPSTYAAALRRIVEHHAHVIVGLPRDYNIVRLLDEIGEQDGLNRYISAEHLQHVLEVYIAGHFLFTVKIDASVPVADPSQPRVLPPTMHAEVHGQTMLEALTSGGARVNAERARLAKQAYTLASLFHDVGHLLFPRDSIPHDSLDWDDPEISAGLQKVEASVSTAGSEVAEKCLQDLGLMYYTKEEQARWRDQLAGGEPNHGLLGAWYLHRVGLGVQDRSSDIDGFREAQAEILRMAVRAVLVHGASTGPLRTDADPVAAMLVVCNEIFEWDQGRHLAPSPNSIGRSFHVMAADVPPREPRDAWIKIQRLSVRAAAGAGGSPNGELESVIHVDASQKSWPEIEVRLQSPQRLDVPVLRLWLMKAQSLGRLVATRHGLCPTVVMRSDVDVTLLSRGLTTKSLLDRVVERKALSAIRPALRAWLAQRDRFEEMERPASSVDADRPGSAEDVLRTEERVRLGPLEQRLLFERLFEWVRKIEEEAWDVVQTIDADHEDEPTSKRFWHP